MTAKKQQSLVDDNSLYIDLFDDDLYVPEEYFTDRKKNSNLRNTIRLQVLLAILFDKRICVPEQWALSSLTFLEVFEEVTSHYEREITYHESRNEEKTWTVPPPITITFRERLHSQTSPLALAFHDRIRNGRRLRIDPVLSLPESEEAKILQAKIGKTLIDYIEGEKKGTLYSNNFQDEIAIILGGTQTAFDTSRRLSKLGKYIDSNVKTTTQHHSPSVYDRDLGYYTQNVKQVCFEPAFASVFQDDRITQFREFWRRSEEAGYQPADIAKMWTVSEELDADAHLLITKMGRYCMHRALSRASQASYGSTFYGAYSGEDDDFDVNIINRMRELELRGVVTSDSVEDFEFLAAKNTSEYEPADKLPWSSIWREVSTFARTSSWSKTRSELKNRFEAASAEEVVTDRFWLGVFDEINSGIRTFVFQKSRLGEGKFDVAVNFRDDIIGSLGQGPVIKVVGTLLMLANMAGANVESLYKLELEATRGFRKAARLKNSLRKGR